MTKKYNPKSDCKGIITKNSDGVYLADVEIASKVEPEIADEVRALNLTGVHFKEDTKRYY